MDARLGIRKNLITNLELCEAQYQKLEKFKKDLMGLEKKKGQFNNCPFTNVNPQTHRQNAQKFHYREKNIKNHARFFDN